MRKYNFNLPTECITARPDPGAYLAELVEAGHADLYSAWKAAQAHWRKVQSRKLKNAAWRVLVEYYDELIVVLKNVVPVHCTRCK